MSDFKIVKLKGTAKFITIDPDVMCPDCNCFLDEDGKGHSSWCVKNG